MATINSINSTINSTTAGIVLSSSSGVLSSSATTDHAIQLGNASGTVSSLGVGSNNTVLSGNTGADPSFATVSNAMLAHSDLTFATSNPSFALGMNFNGGNSALISLGSTVTLDSFGDGVHWQVINGGTTVGSSNWGILCIKNISAPSAFPLPANSNVGDTLYFTWAVASGATGGQIRITQTAGTNQQIFINTSSTTIGITGRLDLALASTGGCITLVCSVANTTWWAFDVLGTWTVT